MSCPSCQGQHHPDDVRGWLRFDHEQTCPLLGAEDSTQLADSDRAARELATTLTRPATPTERQLLAHLGHELPDDLDTRVTFLTTTARRRDWPALTPERTPA